MDDKELVEVWQSEFEKMMPNANLSKHPEGDYIRDPIDAMWRGFLMAKRRQPSVVLPKPWASNEGSLTPDLSTWYRADLVNKRLTAEGIKYTIEE